MQKPNNTFIETPQDLKAMAERGYVEAETRANAIRLAGNPANEHAIIAEKLDDVVMLWGYNSRAQIVHTANVLHIAYV